MSNKINNVLILINAVIIAYAVGYLAIYQATGV